MFDLGKISKLNRIGVCNSCRAVIGEIDCQKDRLCKYTTLHHEKYDSLDVLAYTIELCIRCHRRYDSELGIVKKGAKRNMEHLYLNRSDRHISMIKLQEDTYNELMKRRLHTHESANNILLRVIEQSSTTDNR